MRANPDGSGVTEINQRHAYFSDWRADGERIAIDVIERDLDTQIAILNPDGSDFQLITSERGVHDSPSWSPNGRRLVFNHSLSRLDDPKFQTRLWTIRANGTHERPLPMSDRGFDIEPRYSPDGRWIVFNRLRPPDFDLAVFIVSTKGKHRVRRLTPWRINSEHPTWSPDGRWILFDNAPNGTIQAMRPNGKQRHTIVPASEGFGGHKPWFSPDGTRILFMCENQGHAPPAPTGLQPGPLCHGGRRRQHREHHQHPGRPGELSGLGNWSRVEKLRRERRPYVGVQAAHAPSPATLETAPQSRNLDRPR